MIVDGIQNIVKNLNISTKRLEIDETLIFQAARDEILKHYDWTNWPYCVVFILENKFCVTSCLRREVVNVAWKHKSSSQ